MNDPSLNVDFTDTDNLWDNKNNQKDEIATDAHFGAMKTYDYYKLFHNRKSIDDKDYNLISQVHFLLNYNNATWNGKTMNYGDGDNTNYNPFTLIDVCGHEISHGFTEFTSNLIYYSEPGALNESISDIFGVAIKNWSLSNTSIIKHCVQCQIQLFTTIQNIIKEKVGFLVVKTMQESIPIQEYLTIGFI